MSINAAGFWEQRRRAIVPDRFEWRSQKEIDFGYSAHRWISRLRLFRLQLHTAGLEGHSHRRHRSHLRKDVLSYRHGLHPLDRFWTHAVRVANHSHECCLLCAVGVHPFEEAPKLARNKGYSNRRSPFQISFPDIWTAHISNPGSLLWKRKPRSPDLPKTCTSIETRIAKSQLKCRNWAKTPRVAV